MKEERNINKVRVVVNAIHSKSGGGVTYLENIIPEFASDPDFEIHLVLHEGQLKRFRDFSKLVKLHVVRFRDNMICTQLWEQFVFPFIAYKINADIVYSPANYGPIFVKNPVILIANSLDVISREKRISKIIYWSVLSAMTVTSLVFARHVMAVSHYAMKSVLKGPVAYMQNKMTVIHLGKSALFSPDGRSRSNNLLAVGDIYIQKNYHALLRAVAVLCARHPDLTLRIAGRPLDLEYLNLLRSLVAELGVDDRVVFLGHLTPEQLRDEYRSCKLFVFPSTVETFGMPLVEAMACGAPVAGSNRAAMPEIGGDCMEYFDPEDTDSMVKTIDGLLSDEKRRNALAERSLLRAQQFSWKENAKKTLDVFSEIIRK